MINRVNLIWEDAKSFMTFAFFPVIAGLITFVVVYLLQALIKAIFRR